MTTPTPLNLSTPQAIFLIGGLVNILVSSLVGYVVLWVRTRDPEKPISRYSMVAHTGAIMNGTLLMGFAFAIQYTPFIEPVKTGIAIAEVLATFFFTLRTLISWKDDFQDALSQGTLRSNRLRGLANVIHLFDAAAILYGVARVVFGI
jgi:hypothetical protein